MGEREFEDMLRRVMKADFATGTEAFRDALLARCLAELGIDPHAADEPLAEYELSEAELELLAAAGDVFLTQNQSPFCDNTDKEI